jgi:hypothetical protein
VYTLSDDRRERLLADTGSCPEPPRAEVGERVNDAKRRRKSGLPIQA